MRTRTLLAVPLAALVLLAPLSACSSAPEEQVCAVLEADGDDYVQLPDPALCPSPGTVAADARGPLWVPVSQLDEDDDHRTPVRSTPRTTPRTTQKAAPGTTTPSKTATPPKRTSSSKSR